MGIAELLPLHCVSMIAQELSGMAVTIAKNQFGSRVFHRLCKRLDLERQQSLCFALPEVDQLLEEALGAVVRLCRHEWGRFVILSFMECGTASQRLRIFDALQADAFSHAVHRHAGDIVVQLLAHVSESHRKALASEVLLSCEGGLLVALKTLTLTQHGYRAAKAACAVPGAHRDEVLRNLPAIAEMLSASKQGRRFVRDLVEMQGEEDISASDLSTEAGGLICDTPLSSQAASGRWADLD